MGDIIISAETASRQAEEFGHGLEREIVYLAVHGLLHLLGYDHMTDEDKAVMRAKEEEALREIRLSEDFWFIKRSSYGDEVISGSAGGT